MFHSWDSKYYLLLNGAFSQVWSQKFGSHLLFYQKKLGLGMISAVDQQRCWENPWLCSFGSPAGRGVVPPKPQRRVTSWGCQKMAENFNLWSWWMSEPIGKMNENDIWTYMILYYDPIWTIVSWAKLVWNPILAFRVLLGVYPHLPSFGDKKDSQHGVLT